MPSETDEFRQEWTAALDRLELDLEVAERMLRSHEVEVVPEWREPVMRSPLPEDMVPRARLILERQLAMAHELSHRAATTAQHYALTERLRGTLPPDIPVYVDVTA